MSKPNVTIVGAGIAGLTAGLRLAERGYQVSFYERDWFVGGKFRAFEWIGRETNRRAFHEHSYHMFLNWYHNFFSIADEIGARKNFVPLKSVKFLREGQFPQWKELVNFGSLATNSTKSLFGRAADPGHVSLHVLRDRSPGHADEAKQISRPDHGECLCFDQAICDGKERKPVR